MNDGAEAGVAAALAASDLRVRGCLRRNETSRERLAQHLYDRLHPAMAALGLLFLLLVLAQGPLREGTSLQEILLGLTWLLWLVFVAEYVLRLVIAPSTGRFLRRTWWQVLLLAVPVLMLGRALLLLRVARPTRVALAAFRGGRSGRATLTSRAGWLALVTSIVVFAAGDVLFNVSGVHPYGKALHAAALGAITGEPIPSTNGFAQVLDVVLAVFAVVFFATLAGMVGAFFVETAPPEVDRGAAVEVGAEHPA